jgi:hypothetical protein
VGVREEREREEERLTTTTTTTPPCRARACTRTHTHTHTRNRSPTTRLQHLRLRGPQPGADRAPAGERGRARERERERERGTGDTTSRRAPKRSHAAADKPETPPTTTPKQQQIARTAHPPAVTLVASFADPDYNRTSLTLASSDPFLLAQCAADVAAAALPRVDLTRHSAAHPRLGAVDHVSVHPLGWWWWRWCEEEEEQGSGRGRPPPIMMVDTTEAEITTNPEAYAASSRCARMLGAALAAPRPCGLPVYYYGGASSTAAEAWAKRWSERRSEDGVVVAAAAEDDKEAAHATGETTTTTTWHPRAHLADLRRRMGYFTPTTTATWQGPPPGLHGGPPPVDEQGQPLKLLPRQSHATPLRPAPDEALSPTVADPRAGVCLVGSTAVWVVNLNAPLRAVVGVGGSSSSSNEEQDARRRARRVARRVSERGGGLKGVQAMALDKRVVGGKGGAAESSTPLLFTGDYAPAEQGGVVVAKAAEVAAVTAAADADNTTTTTTIIEVACNLLSPDAGGATVEAVAREIARLAKEEGLEPAGAAYRIGASPGELAERWAAAQQQGGM